MSILLIVSLLILPSHIPADCVCLKTPGESIEAVRRDHFDKAAAVFVGKVIAFDGFSVTFKLLRRWKGSLDQEITMSTGAIAGFDGTPLPQECLYSRFDLGAEYLVYAFSNGKEIKPPDACYTWKIKEGNEEEKKLDRIKRHEIVSTQ